MKIQTTKNSKTQATFQTHVINAKIVEVKLPRLGQGKGWKTAKAKLNGEEIVLNYNSARPTGVYFRYKGNVNYTKDRTLLECRSLQEIVKEKKAETPAPETPAAENGEESQPAA